MFKGRKNRVG